MAINTKLQVEIPAVGCDQCDGFGNLMTPEGVKPCECKIRAATAHNLINSGIPPMFSKKTFESFNPKIKGCKQAFERCKKFVDNYPLGTRGLLLHGDCGTGKTHIAVAILRELIQKGNTGLFYNVISLLDDLRATFALDNSTNQWPILDRICGIDILVLDDLGAEKTSGWVSDRLYAIINHRYEHQKTTIVTTNKSVTELKEQVGNRIQSRLNEMCEWVLFEGEDYRVKMMTLGRT